LGTEMIITKSGRWVTLNQIDARQWISQVVSHNTHFALYFLICSTRTCMLESLFCHDESLSSVLFLLPSNSQTSCSLLFSSHILHTLVS
jgi:hypothetical protein